MYSKFVTALIILTVAALCAAAAFQYLEMESFGLPKTLQERFFPEPPPAPAASEESSETANQASAEGENNAENSNSQNAPAAQE